MHDPSLPDERVLIDTKALEQDMKKLAKMLSVTQSTAVTAMGYATKILGKVVTAKEAHDYIQMLIKTKQADELSPEERMLCITVGLIKRKAPFLASAKVVGRNDLCPCGSGGKYKKCCLEMAKEHDHSRFYGGKQ